MATTPEITVRLLAQAYNDTGEEAAAILDETLLCQGFGQRTIGRRIYVEPADADASISLGTNAIGLILYSHQYEFSYRLLAGETLVGPTRLAVVAWNDDTDTGALPAAILLTGNGSNRAEVEMWVVLKAP